MAELHCVVNDGYDRELFSHALAREPALQRTLSRAKRLLPQAEPFLADLFFSLFKLNVELRPTEEVAASALVNHRLVQAVSMSNALAELRRRTLLDELQASAATTALADLALTALTRDFRVLAKELVELASLALDEAELEKLQAELDHLDEIEPADFPNPELSQLLRESLKRDLSALTEKLEKKRSEQAELASSLSREIDTELSWKMGRLSQQLDQMDEQLESLGLGRGADGKVSAGTRLELGQRLLDNRKLQLLAKLTGAFREVAFEARRRHLSRAPQELHEVKMGAELERLLPSELLELSAKHRELRLDFLRRLIDGQLLQYQLHGAAQRGPMVICLDGSGSMQGSKELWAKAVALTMMEIARRERRRCLAIIFSAGDPLFEVELLATSTDRGAATKKRGGRAAVRDAEVIRFAEHFPGGGTSFEEPLARAVDAVSTGDYRRGDVVFITDGEAHVSDELVRRIDEKRKKYRFRIRGIEVDVKRSRGDTLARFCDDVRTVTDLTADSIKDIFASV